MKFGLLELLIVGVVGAIVYAFIPPVGDLNPPHLASLAMFQKVGCGLGSLNSYASTVLYYQSGPKGYRGKEVIADDATRSAVDQEALSLGYVKSLKDGTLHYSKDSAAILGHRTQWIWISSKGRICTGAAIDKWPHL